MFGPSIEQAFPHIAFEQEQRMRKLEMQRLLEADQPQRQPSRRSLTTIFARLTPRFAVRTPDGPSPFTPS
jgi:hypothetical protein